MTTTEVQRTPARGGVSIADALRDVKVVFVRPSEDPPRDAWWFSVRWLHPRPRSAALAYLESPARFRGPAVRDDAPVVALFVRPSLDDVVALAMWAWERSRGAPARGRAWEAVAHYADNVRQGFLPETVPPNRAPQSLYRAIAEARLRGDRSGFVEPAVWLVEHLVEEVEHGRSLLADDLAGEEPFLVEYLQLLQNDAARYAEDLERAARHEARLPPEAAGGVATQLPLVAIASPRATHFRIWAQRDPGAPGGAGYPLLLTYRPTTPPGLADVQITACPDAKVTVSFLASALSDAERRVAGPAAEPWYAGADYEDRMVASPDEGTRLSFEQVVEAIRGPLALRPVKPRGEAPPPPGWQARLWLGGIAVAIVIALGIIYGGTGPADPAGGGARGVGLVVETPEDLEAFRRRRDHALVLAVDHYDDRGFGDLGFPVKQAGEIARELGRRGFAVEFLPDPTRAQVVEALRKLRVAWPGGDSQLLVYFAGHGTVSSLGVGQLVLRDSKRGEDDTTYSLADLRQSLASHPSKHVLVVLDSCYAGMFRFEPHLDLGGTEAGETRGAPTEIDEGLAFRMLRRPTRRYLTSVGVGATPDDSVFSARIIEFLRARPSRYTTEESIRERIQDVRAADPLPHKGTFEGDQGGAFVFRPPAP